MDKLLVRALDPAEATSGDEAEGYTSKSEGESLKSLRRLKVPAGRMKRTASAPVQAILSMLSRTG